MKIYNEYRTKELNEKDIDFEKGYLRADKILIARHEAVSFQRGRSAKEIAEELKAQGIGIEIGYDGKPYRIIKDSEKYGREVEAIEDEPDTPAKGAWNEEEEIQVYILYTEEELEEHRLSALRSRRAPLLEAFDKWEKAVLRGRESDDIAVMEWYKRMLDLDELAFESIPLRIQYYVG